MKVALTLGCVLLAAPASAQWVIHDPANVAEAGVIGTIHAITKATHTSIDNWYKRLKRSYWVFEPNVQKYHLENPPRWRTFQMNFDTTQASTKAFMGALNAGDFDGSMTSVALEPLQPADPEGAASPDLRTDLAVFEWAESSMRSAIHQTGTIRANRRSERVAIAALESDVVRTGNSTTMTAGTLSGAALLRARLAQNRGQLALARLDLALVQTAHGRIAEAAAVALRTAPPPADLSTGTTRALQDWRLP